MRISMIKLGGDVNWRPLEEDPSLQSVLANLDSEEIDKANSLVIRKILRSNLRLETIEPARKVIKIRDDTFLHAGPSVSWQHMCGPMKGAMIGACIYEGLAEGPLEAEKLLESDKINFVPCNDYNAVAPMAGVISPSMPIVVVRNKTYGNIAYSNLNEGLGRVLRFGAYESEVIKRLHWMEEKLAPALKISLEGIGGIDLNSILSRALLMGDECHNRNVASTSLFARELFPSMIANLTNSDTIEVSKFLQGNDHFFLNLSMAACKATMAAASSCIRNSTIVTIMSRNGSEFGIKIGGINEWFTSKAPVVDGLYLPGYSLHDANPDLGDSSIVETCGFGGFAMAASPGIVQFVGGNYNRAIDFTKDMYNITLAKNSNYPIPYLNFSGIPSGIDFRNIVNTGILPVINTGIAHRFPGVGQIGAGITRAPKDCFLKALKRCAEIFG